MLRPSKINPGRIRTFKNYKNENFEGKRHLVVPKGNGSFNIDSIDLSGITGVNLMITSQAALQFGYTFEIYFDSPGGQKLGELVVPANAITNKQEKLLKISIQPVSDGKFHHLVFVSKANDPSEKTNIGIQWIELQSR